MAIRPSLLNLNHTSRIERAKRPALVSEHWFSLNKEIRKQIITQLAALRGRIKLPQQQEVEMLDRMGMAMSSMLNSRSGFERDPGDSSPFPAGSICRADEVFSMGQTVKGAGGVLAAAGGIAAMGAPSLLQWLWGELVVCYI